MGSTPDTTPLSLRLSLAAARRSDRGNAEVPGSSPGRPTTDFEHASHPYKDPEKAREAARTSTARRRAANPGADRERDRVRKRDQRATAAENDPYHERAKRSF